MLSNDTQNMTLYLKGITKRILQIAEALGPDRMAFTRCTQEGVGRLSILAHDAQLLAVYKRAHVRVQARSNSNS